MAKPLNLEELIANGTLDPELIDRLRATDPEKVRALLSRYLPDEEIDGVLRRLEALLAARDKQRP